MTDDTKSRIIIFNGGVVFKKIEWMKASRRLLKNFPDDARNIAGNQLWLVQQGRQPADWKPIKGIGPGAIEIRIHRPNEYRVIYVAKFSEAIYVLHCFAKRTQKTSERDLKIARVAYAEMEKSRKEEGYS